MAPATEIFVPEPPVVSGALGQMPERVKKEWKEMYAKAHRQAQLDSPNEPSVHPQRARRTANRLFEIAAPPTNYEEAMALPDWQVVKREEKEGKLTLVTIEARGPEPSSPDEPRSAKFVFDVPERKAKSAKG